MNPVLRITPPGEPPMEVALEIDQLTLGRSESNHIVVKTPQVSSVHLELRREAGEFRLVDLQSTNGTKINGKAVEEAILEDGDEILIGGAVAAAYSHPLVSVVEVAEALPPAAPAAAPALSAPAIPATMPKRPVLVSGAAAKPVAPTVALKRAGGSLPAARPPIKIAKPAPPGGRKPGGS